MRLEIANRTVACRFGQENWWPNPDWVNAPLEMIQLPDGDVMLVDGDGRPAMPPPPVTGPYRFKAQDREKAEQYAREQNWDALGKLAVPERIPPTT